MIKRSKILLSVIGIILFSNNEVQGQNLSQSELDGRQNTITTAVPFLMITPDSRAAAMGDVGVATSADINSIYWNVAKYAFIEKKNGLSISYAPWLKELVPDISFSHLAGYTKIGKDQVLSGSFRYFSLGDIQFRDNQGEDLGSENPFEMAIDAGYSRKLNDKFSVGIALRYIHSNLTGKRISNLKPGNAVAGDIGAFYKSEFNEKIDYAVGANVSNLGSKITFSTDENRDFIPMNIRLGTAWEFEIDEHNSFTAALDFNKLLVPTPEIFNDSGQVIYGKSSDVAVIQGIMQSFSDAPGGFKEELREVNWSLGLEYWYDKQFAVRAGYFHEHETKGDRQYLTFGAGIKYKVFGLDMAYLVPTENRHPLQGQVRFSLLFDLESFESQE